MQLPRKCNVSIDQSLTFLCTDDAEVGDFTRTTMPEDTDAFVYVERMKRKRKDLIDSLVHGQALAIWRARASAETNSVRVWSEEGQHTCSSDCDMEQLQIEVFTCVGGPRCGMHHVCLKSPKWTCTLCNDRTVHTCKRGRAVQNLYVCTKTGVGHLCFPGPCKGPHILTGHSRTCMVTGRSVAESKLTVSWGGQGLKNASSECEHLRGNQSTIEENPTVTEMDSPPAPHPKRRNFGKDSAPRCTFALPGVVYKKQVPTANALAPKWKRVTAMLDRLLPGGGQRSEIDDNKLKKTMSYCARIVAKTALQSLQDGQTACLTDVHSRIYTAMFKPCNYVEKRVHTDAYTRTRLCEMYAATAVEWWVHLSCTPMGVPWPPVHMTCEVFSLCVLHISKRGMYIDDLAVIPKDEFLASQLSGATALRALSPEYGMRTHDSAFTNTCKEIRGLLFELRGRDRSLLAQVCMLPYDLTAALTTAKPLLAGALQTRRETSVAGVVGRS